MLFLLIGLVGAAAAVLLYASGSVLVERAEVRESLRRLEGYQVQSTRDKELLPTFDERVLSPIGDRFLGIGRRITPTGYVDGVRRRLEQAGKPIATADQFVAGKAVALVGVVVWFLLVFVVLGMGGLLGIVLFLGLTAAGFFLPDMVLNNKVKARKHEIAVQLPDLLDLLTISVEAGLGFEQALDRTTAAIPGALSSEFERMLREMRLGTSRSDSLRALEARTDVPELRSFVLAMLQADTFGVSISRLLRAQAEDMRTRRRQRAQEQAQKAPVKMLFQMVFCIFPSIFVIVLGPALIGISESL